MRDTLTERLADVRRRIADAAGGRAVTVVAMTAGRPLELIRAAYAAGLDSFGERDVAEWAAKDRALPDLDVLWHLVGPVHPERLAPAVDRMALIHGVDNLALAEAMNRRAIMPVDVLIEVRLDDERRGVRPDELAAVLDGIRRLDMVVCRGLTCAGRAGFGALAALARQHGLTEVSMGSSDDFEEAVAEGATIVRLGRALFGAP